MHRLSRYLISGLVAITALIVAILGGIAPAMAHESSSLNRVEASATASDGADGDGLEDGRGGGSPT